jgi:hypothetical protein
VRVKIVDGKLVEEENDKELIKTGVKRKKARDEENNLLKGKMNFNELTNILFRSQSEGQRFGCFVRCSARL